MDLSNLSKIKGNKGKKKRIARGYGSGKGGHTCGRGTKGQNARSGNSLPYGFEGGQTQLFKKLPQIGGFRNPAKKNITAIGTKEFNIFKSGVTVTPKDLVDKKILNKLPKDGVKIIINGNLEKKLIFDGFLFSAGARNKLEELGCTIKGN